MTARKSKSKPALTLVDDTGSELDADGFAVPPQQAEMPFAVVEGEPITQLPKDLYIPPDALQVFLEAFEGPLDLLLYLIRRQNLDVLDIPIAEITRQYMQYIEVMQELQLELAGEYLLMAAMLAEIKSRMLLPNLKGDGEEEEDPRAELVRRLQEYERFKKAAEDLDRLPRMERDTMAASAEIIERKVARAPPQVSLQEMLQAFKEVLSRADMFAHHHIRREQLSVRQRMMEILDRLRQSAFIEFVRLFDPSEGRMGVTVTFIAMLELMKEGLLEIVQAQPYAPIHVRPASGKRHLSVVDAGAALAADAENAAALAQPAYPDENEDPEEELAPQPSTTEPLNVDPLTAQAIDLAQVSDLERAPDAQLVATVDAASAVQLDTAAPIPAAVLDGGTEPTAVESAATAEESRGDASLEMGCATASQLHLDSVVLDTHPELAAAVAATPVEPLTDAIVEIEVVALAEMSAPAAEALQGDTSLEMGSVETVSPAYLDGVVLDASAQTVPAPASTVQLLAEAVFDSDATDALAAAGAQSAAELRGDVLLEMGSVEAVLQACLDSAVLDASAETVWVPASEVELLAEAVFESDAADALAAAGAASAADLPRDALLEIGSPAAADLTLSAELESCLDCVVLDARLESESVPASVVEVFVEAVFESDATDALAAAGAASAAELPRDALLEIGSPAAADMAVIAELDIDSYLQSVAQTASAVEPLVEVVFASEAVLPAGVTERGIITRGMALSTEPAVVDVAAESTASPVAAPTRSTHLPLEREPVAADLSAEPAAPTPVVTAVASAADTTSQQPLAALPQSTPELAVAESAVAPPTAAEEVEVSTEYAAVRVMEAAPAWHFDRVLEVSLPMEGATLAADSNAAGIAEPAAAVDVVSLVVESHTFTPTDTLPLDVAAGMSSAPGLAYPDPPVTVLRFSPSEVQPGVEPRGAGTVTVSPEDYPPGNAGFQNYGAASVEFLYEVDVAAFIAPLAFEHDPMDTPEQGQ